MKTQTLKENKMGTMSLTRLLINMALPMVIAMLVQALYNVVDSIYVSQISESAVTALSLAFPVQNIMIGCATGIGVGVNALVSKSLGEGDRKTAGRAAGNGFFLVAVVTVLFALFGIFGTRPFFAVQSTVAETVDGGTVYTSICCLFAAGIFVEVLGERLLQSSGRTIYTLITQGTGAVLNILLDPVFIFGVPWLGIQPMGIAGAAVATVIGQWVAAILALIFNFKCNPEIQFGFKDLKPVKRVVGQILTVGIPSIIMVAVGSVMNFSMNQILQGFNETATGVFGIYYKLQSFFFMPLFGLNNGTVSIVAYNYGARKPHRITGTLKRSCMMALGVMILGLLAFQLAPDMLLGIFNPSEEFLRIGRSALQEISWAFPMAAIGIALTAGFQALGNGSYSTIISLCRQMLVLLPAAYLLSLTGEVTNVWWAFPIAECVSLAVTMLFFLRIYKRKIKPLSE
ncbi:MAG: MATE family efflux transporter [Oscillospiraceae bacterium]|nr:MATE family efflux transporter [Oscillospiraceae bacterium]MBQ9930493.1 MATE family efflux transporter [Oscillospiraceae bacterium]